MCAEGPGHKLRGESHQIFHLGQYKSDFLINIWAVRNGLIINKRRERVQVVKKGAGG